MRRWKEWNALVKKYEKAFPELGAAFHDIRLDQLPAGWEKSLPKFDGVEAKATRAYSGEVINAIADSLLLLVGGSADLKPSNNTYINSSADIQPGTYQNRNIHYGIREHAMGSAMNGMALYGSVIPFGGTFQTFSDYMRPAIRLALLHIQTIFVFTHDFIGLGEDGPTHQSVEHIAAMRRDPKSRGHSPLRRPRNPRSVACCDQTPKRADRIRSLASKGSTDRPQKVRRR